MRVLVIGGTGLISVGIVKHLLARKADVTVFNRGRRPSTLPAQVKVRWVTATIPRSHRSFPRTDTTASST